MAMRITIERSTNSPEVQPSVVSLTLREGVGVIRGEHEDQRFLAQRSIDRLRADEREAEAILLESLVDLTARRPCENAANLMESAAQEYKDTGLFVTSDALEALGVIVGKSESFMKMRDNMDARIRGAVGDILKIAQKQYRDF